MTLDRLGSLSQRASDRKLKVFNSICTARIGRSRPGRGALSRIAVGRRATARGDCACARDAPARPALRRADERARPAARRGDARTAAQVCRRGAHDGHRLPLHRLSRWLSGQTALHGSGRGGRVRRDGGVVARAEGRTDERFCATGTLKRRSC
jgi:hypothetical protein